MMTKAEGLTREKEIELLRELIDLRIEVRHLRTNAVGPPDYMRLKVRAEKAERAYADLHENFTQEGAEGCRRGKDEERTRIVKLLREEAVHKQYGNDDCACTLEALVNEIERGPGD